MLQEKRRTPRIFFEDTVRYETDRMSIATIAYDINSQAIFIKTLRPLPIDTILIIHIPNLDTDNPNQKLRAIGRVIATRNQDGYPRGMVVKFDYKRCSNIKKLVRRYIHENRFYMSGSQFLKTFYDISSFTAAAQADLEPEEITPPSRVDS